MNLEIGKKLGHYEILGALGAGGMGEVYRARDTNLKREVALKVLPSHVSNNPDSLSRFEREALTLAQLSHPNIVSIHDFGKYGGVTLAVTELLEGETLRSRIERGPIPTRKALEIASLIAEGLSAAHSKGVVHRDLKPENVFLTSDDQVKVLDFGLARVDLIETSGDGSKSSLPTQTDPGSIKGTVGYMSPEQLRGQPVDARSDVFALGCILYEMLTGRRAFAKDTVADTITAILAEDVPDFYESGRQLSPEAERVATHCLEKDPSKRFQSAKDLALHLRALVSSPEISASLPGFKKSGGRPGLWVASAFLLLVVTFVVFLAIHFRSPRQAPSGPPSLAVMYFENNTGDPSLDWLRAALANMLVTDLSQSTQIEVLGTDRMFQIMKEMGQEDSPAISFEVIQELARKANINTVLVGSFVKAGDSFRLSTRLQEASSGRILSTERVEGEGEASLFPMVDEITNRVKATLEISASTDKELDKGIEKVTSSSVEAYRYYVNGNALHTQSKELQAIPELEKALELDPEFAMAMAKLSVAYWNVGRVQESFDYAAKALQHVDRLTARERYYVEGRYYSLSPLTIRKAVDAYEQAVRLYPDHGPARHNLANLYLELERYEDAIAQYSESVRRGSNFAGTFTNLANAYSAAGKLDQGLEVVASYSEANPDNASGHRDLGIYLMTLDRYDEAQAELQRALALDPGDLGAVRGRIMVSILQNDWEHAERMADALTGEDDVLRRVTGYTHKAFLAAYRGQSDRIRSLCDRALTASPSKGPIRADILVSFARFSLEMGDPEKALELALEAAETGQGFPIELEALVTRALAQASLGRIEAANERFEEMRTRLSGYPEHLLARWEDFNSGLVSSITGEDERAISEFSRVASALPEHASKGAERINTWYRLGLSYLRTGNPEQAIGWFRRVVDSSYERVYNPIVWVRSLYLLGKAFEEQGKTESAGEAYEDFLLYWGEGQMDVSQVRAARDFVASLPPS